MSEAEYDFKLYLSRYCKTYDITLEDAEQHELVKEVKQYYIDAYKDRATDYLGGSFSSCEVEK